MDAPFHIDVFHFISVHVDGFYTPFSYLKKGMGDPHFGERQRENLQNNVYMAMCVLYFANAIGNPFIYGFIDHAFRRKLVIMFVKKGS